MNWLQENEVQCHLNVTIQCIILQHHVCVKHINIISFKHEFVLHFTMASSSRHYCQNKPHSFCYICAAYTFLHQKPNITSFVRRAYKAYFQVALGDQGVFHLSAHSHLYCSQSSCLLGRRMEQKACHLTNFTAFNCKSNF